MGLHDLQAAASIRCHQQLEVTARLVRTIRGNRPQVEILVRADSHYACPQVLDGCEANGIDDLFGLAQHMKRHVGGLEASTAARFRADPSDGKVRRFKEFFDAAGSWSRVRRIVARGSGRDAYAAPPR